MPAHANNGGVIEQRAELALTFSRLAGGSWQFLPLSSVFGAASMCLNTI